MYFIGTRGKERVKGAEAIVKGIAEDGGLFVPESFPAVSFEELGNMLGMDYPERVAYLLAKFFDEYDREELTSALREGFSRFETEDPVPLVRMDEGLYLLELFHGPTCSEKDLGFAALPYLLEKGRGLSGIEEKLLLPVATSGDTGKAALESFKDADWARLAVFFPEEGVSKMQKFWLCTQEGENLDVVAVRGSFDDCQFGVKRMMGSEKCKKALLRKGYVFSSVNSMNIARTVASSAAFFSAYCDLVSSEQISMGEKVDFAVAAGNFGDALACDYAARMGLPVGKIVCGSNRNGSLSDFFKTGNLDTKRQLFRTMSPALDLSSPSDLERLLFEVSGRDAALTEERMDALSATGKLSVRAEERKALSERYFAGSVSEDDTVECMYEFFMEYGYPTDTQTGVAMSVTERYLKKQEDDHAEARPVVVLCTASPYKYPQDVLYALTGNDVKDSFKGVKRIHLLTAMKVPEPIKAVRYKPIRFKASVSPDKMFDAVVKFLG